MHRNSLKSGHKIHWYEIKEILGQGGFGITYLAYDCNLDKYVAIKEYLPVELAVRDEDSSVHPASEDYEKEYRCGLEGFITEARTLSKFKHPNIVHVLSVSESNNTAYMVMEYEEGESLEDILKEKKTLGETELLEIIIPIMDGLQIVHKAGFIHRDIKPDNIYIRKNGSPVLLDFGSARHTLSIEAKTLTAYVSKGFAPYEQYVGKSDEQGPWTDIYGLGATMYRAVTSIKPQDALYRSDSIIQLSEDTLVSATEIGHGNYSEKFLKTIDHALQFKYRERPQSIDDWKDEFNSNVLDSNINAEKLDYIFLDIDGVVRPLTNDPYDLDSYCIKCLERIVLENPSVNLVITSSWKLGLTLKEIRNYFPKSIAGKIVGVTPELRNKPKFYRQKEAMLYLKKAGKEDTTWVAIDDDDSAYNKNRCRLLLTDSDNGLDDESVEKFRALLSI